MRNGRIFIAWVKHSRRSQLIAEKLGLRLFLVHALKRRPWLAPLRYLLQSWQTWQILMREKPGLVFVQNPPIFAALIVYVYARLWGARFVIDSHSAAFMGGAWRWSLPLHAYLSRRAVTTIITNPYLEAQVQAWGAPTFIIADIPTVFPAGRPYPLNGRFSVAVINTFAPDEPLDEVLAAARALPEVQFLITGDPIRANRAHLANGPANVTFTGFLPDENYIGMLRAVNAIVVLTTRDHTMQRGACEAVSLGKPIITSDWPLLREYFHKGTLHVDNTAAGLAAAIREMQTRERELEREVSALQAERRAEWETKQTEIERWLAAAGVPAWNRTAHQREAR